MHYLSLFIKNIEIASIEIQLPPFDDALSFQENCDLREIFVNYEVNKLRIRYTRQLVKFKFDYEIVARYSSKANDIIISELEMENFEISIENKVQYD